MQINTDLIRALRKKRGWTQEQLATVAALGHRTVHRIENEGIASAESIMAIASALSVSVESLQISESERKPYKSKNFLALDLLVRLCLATFSGLLVSLLLQWTVNQNIKQYFGTDSFGSDAGYFLCGILFGLLVVYPYLTKDRMFSWRALGLVAFCGISFHVAIWVLVYSQEYLFGENVQSFMLASVTGSLVVLLAVHLFTALILPAITWVLTFVASLFSGAYMYLAVYVLADYDFYSLASIIGFCMWHTLIALILFHGCHKSGSGHHGDTILSPVINKLLELLGTRADRISRWLTLGFGVKSEMPSST